MSKKIFRVMVLMVVVGALLSACGTATPAPVATDTQAVVAAATTAAPVSTATTAPTVAKPVKLDWWQLSGNDNQIKAWNEIIAAYQTLHPNVTITLETRAVDAHKDALRTAENTDAFPDIFFMWSGLGLGGEFVNAGASAPLDAYYTQYGWDKILSPSAVAAAHSYNDGHYHGVMSELHGEVIFYRKDLFTKAGITAVPTTYADLIADNEKLLAINVKPIEFSGTVNWHLMRLLDELVETKCGADTHDQLNGMTASWATTPCVADAFTELKTWSTKYIVSDFLGMDYNTATQLIYDGKAAMMLEGDWMDGTLISAKQDLNNYGLFIFPTGTGRLYGFAQGNYISANSKNKDEAAAFLNYFSSKEVQQKYLGTFGALSVNTQVTLPDTAVQLDKDWVGIFGASKGLFQNNDQAFPLAVTTEYWRIQNLVASGGEDPLKAGADLQKFMDNNK